MKDAKFIWIPREKYMMDVLNLIIARDKCPPLIQG